MGNLKWIVIWLKTAARAGLIAGRHLWNSYNFILVSFSKTYARGGTSRRGSLDEAGAGRTVTKLSRLLRGSPLPRAQQGARDDGYPDAGPRLGLLRGRDCLHLCMRAAVRERCMIVDYSLAGLVSLGLLIYLTYALLRPERF